MQLIVAYSAELMRETRPGLAAERQLRALRWVWWVLPVSWTRNGQTSSRYATGSCVQHIRRHTGPRGRRAAITLPPHHAALLPQSSVRPFRPAILRVAQGHPPRVPETTSPRRPRCPRKACSSPRETDHHLRSNRSHGSHGGAVYPGPRPAGRGLFSFPGFLRGRPPGRAPEGELDARHSDRRSAVGRRRQGQDD